MGKTYRHNPDSEEYSRGKFSLDIPFVRRTVQPKVISVEWALTRMAEHINFNLEGLIEGGLINPCDKQEYVEMIQKYIEKAVPKYDPNHKSEHNGKTCSAVHYFTIVVDGITRNIRKYQENKLRTHIPISHESEKCASDQSMISAESKYLSDQCRSVKELWFKMDVGALMSLLTAEEQTTLKGRLLGYTDEEIAQHLGIKRMRIAKTLIKHIQAKARLCGFIPRSEVRGS